MYGRTCCDDFRVDPAALDAVGRMAGNTWVRTRDRIELIRPKSMIALT